MSEIAALRDRFSARFAGTARARLASCFDALVESSADVERIRQELHALAGEASMLDYAALADAARVGERAAIAWSQGDRWSAVKCARAIRAAKKELSLIDEAVARRRPESRSQTSPARVVIVDDSAIVAASVADELSARGATVDIATTVPAAISLLGEIEPELVVVDVHMPAYQGEPPYRALARITADRGMRILLFSGMEEARLEALSQQIGATGFVSKGAGSRGAAGQILQHLRGARE